MAESILKEKSFAFSLRIIKLYRYLSENRKEFVISKQVLRCGTAVGALIREAQNAESKADFVHKLGIAQKECDETKYWLELLVNSDIIDNTEFNSLHEEATALLKMIKSSILTTKNTHLKPNNR